MGSGGTVPSAGGSRGRPCPGCEGSPTEESCTQEPSSATAAHPVGWRDLLGSRTKLGHKDLSRFKDAPAGWELCGGICPPVPVLWGVALSPSLPQLCQTPLTFPVCSCPHGKAQPRLWLGGRGPSLCPRCQPSPGSHPCPPQRGRSSAGQTGDPRAPRADFTGPEEEFTSQPAKQHMGFNHRPNHRAAERPESY